MSEKIDEKEENLIIKRLLLEFNSKLSSREKVTSTIFGI